MHLFAARLELERLQLGGSSGLLQRAVAAQVLDAELAVLRVTVLEQKAFGEPQAVGCVKIACSGWVPSSRSSTSRRAFT